MIARGELAGIVLAGGDSRRMGRDKAMLVVAGQPLWQRQAAVLAGAGANPVALGRRVDQPDLRTTQGHPIWRDTVANVGPLAGLHAALNACPADWLAVVAVDLPAIDSAWFLWLATHCRPGTGAIPLHPDGHFEPLAAIYPAAARDEVNRRVHGRDFSLQSLADHLVKHEVATAVPVPAAKLPLLRNWNSPGD